MIDVFQFITAYPRDLSPNWQPKPLLMSTHYLTRLEENEPSVPAYMLPTNVL